MNATSNAIVAGTWLGKLSRKEICRMAPTKADKPEAWHKWIQLIYLNKEFYVAGGRDKRKKKGSKGSRKKKEVLPSTSSESNSDSSDDEAATQAAAQREADRKNADEHNRKRAAEAAAAKAAAAQAAEARAMVAPVSGASSSSSESDSSSEDEATKRRKRKEAAKAAKAAEKAAAKAAANAAKEAAKKDKKSKKGSKVDESKGTVDIETSAGNAAETAELSLEDLLLGPSPLTRSASDSSIAKPPHGQLQAGSQLQLGRSTSDGALNTVNTTSSGAAPVFDLAAWAANGDDSD